MSTLARINYIIAAVVIVLGFTASYVTFKANETAEDVVAPATVETVEPPPEPEMVEPPAFKSVQTNPAPQDFADWRYECKLSLEGMEDCAAYQKVFAQDTKKEALKAVLMMTKRGGKPTPRLQLVTPLGAFLPAGLSMKLEAEEAFIVPFQYCKAEGCFINLDLAPDVVEAMKRGGAMRVEYLGSDKRLSSVDVSLNKVKDVLKRIAE